MATANALFKRHVVAFRREMYGQELVPKNEAVLLYCACIIAEAVRNELDEPEDCRAPGAPV